MDWHEAQHNLQKDPLWNYNSQFLGHLFTGGGEMGENCLQLAQTSKYLTIQGDREKEGNRRTGRKKEINRLGEIQ